MSISVQILLATYNGERFLREQLDSLVNQTFQDFTILIRDDGSTDDTLKIIKEYQQKNLLKIKLLIDEKRNVGAAQNFGILLENSTADYMFFCDQDDVWLNEKMELSLTKMLEVENMKTIMPCLIFSNMMAIDELGNVTNNSVWKQLKLHPEYFTLNRLLIQNIPHGCTMLVNKALRNIACPIPTTAILHDHWVALLSVACGNWSFISDPLILLRNHTENVTRKKSSLTDKLNRFTINFLSKKEYEYFIKIRVDQARALLNRINAFATHEQRELLKNFLLLENKSGFKRKKILLQNNFFRTTLWHTLKMILRA